MSGPNNETVAKPRAVSFARLGVALFLVVNCFCCFGSGGMPPVKLYAYGLFGWITFVADVAPKVHVNPVAVATFAVTLLLTTVGVHVFASWLRDSMRPDRPAWRVKGTLSIVALFVLAFVAGIAAVGAFHQTTWLVTQPEPFFEAQGGWSYRGNEVGAMGELRSIDTAQRIFREADKDKDSVEDFGTLEELAAAGLLDTIVGAGTKRGYRFEAAPSVVSSELLWFAVASPLTEKHGRRTFFTNQTGQIYYTSGGPFSFDRATCDVPPGLLPHGK